MSEALIIIIAVIAGLAILSVGVILWPITMIILGFAFGGPVVGLLVIIAILLLAGGR